MMANTREYNFWFVLQRAENIPGEWTAHCLELDVVSQGRSLRHAMEMLHEACCIVVCDDLVAGRDPLDRRAPAKFWDDLYKIIEKDKKVNFSTLEEDKVHSIACQILCGEGLNRTNRIHRHSHRLLGWPLLKEDKVLCKGFSPRAMVRTKRV